MKKLFVLLSIIFSINSCDLTYKVYERVKINDKYNSISSITFYDLGNTFVHDDVQEFKKIPITGIVEENYINTLVNKIKKTSYVQTKYIDKSVIVDPYINFFGNTILIKYDNNETTILCSYYGSSYDANNSPVEYYMGYNEELESILKETLNHLK